jgi:hypothetical protein
MGARTFRVAAFGHGAISGGSHAPRPSYAQPTSGPPVHHRVPSGPRHRTLRLTKRHAPCAPGPKAVQRRHDPRHAFLMPRVDRCRVRHDRRDARGKTSMFSTCAPVGRNSNSLDYCASKIERQGRIVGYRKGRACAGKDSGEDQVSPFYPFGFDFRLLIVVFQRQSASFMLRFCLGFRSLLERSHIARGGHVNLLPVEEIGDRQDL